MIDIINISLKLGEAEGLKEVITKAGEGIKHSPRSIKEAFAAIELLSLAASQFILIRNPIVHGPYFAIHCKLVNLHIIFWIEDLQLSHLLRHFSQKQACEYFLLVQDELECNFASLIEPNLKDDDSAVVEEGHEVVLDDDGERGNTWEAEFLEHHMSSAANHSSCIEISIVVAENHFALGGLSDCCTHCSAHLCRHTVSLSFSSHLHYLL